MGESSSLELGDACCALRVISESGLLTVERSRLRGSHACFLLVVLLPVTLLVSGSLTLLPCLVWAAWVEHSVLVLGFVLLLGVALIPAVYAWFVFQGMLFPYTVSVGSAQYRIRNGALRWSLAINMADVGRATFFL